MESESVTSPQVPSALGPEIYRLVAEQMADALILADPQGTIRVWNAAAATLFGFSPQEALGTSLDLIIPEHLRAAHWSAFHRAMAQGATLHGAKARLTRALHADGRRLYVSMSFAVIEDGAGKALASVAIAREAEKPSAY
ncbi:MAG: PAS domain S-box protein [Betaproteobacteria bacterium]|nr:PAS domain S-box protein [Betaproteobacteria bacterium]